MCKKYPNKNKCSYEEWFDGIENNNDHLPIDQSGICLFHSTDIAWKRNEKFSLWMNRYLEDCLQSSKVSMIQFNDTTFVKDVNEKEIDLTKRIFSKSVKFEYCDFIDIVSFSFSNFEKNVDFRNCNFNTSSFFRDITCLGNAFWNECKFEGSAYYNNAVFSPQNMGEYVSFNFSTFAAQANFPSVTFKGDNVDANFQMIDFQDNIYFTNTVFEMSALFNGTLFNKRGDFRWVKFLNNVFFAERPDKNRKVVFKIAAFGEATFEKKADYINADLGEADFTGINISSTLFFSNCCFNEATFHNPVINKNSKLVFSGSEENKVFKKLSSFQIDDSLIVDDSFISFLGCDLSKFYPVHVNKLKELEKKDKVYFDSSCIFEPNKAIRVYRDLYDRAWWIFKDILIGLADWIKILTGEKAIILKVDDRLNENAIWLHIKWNRDEDYILFRRLFNYYILSISSYLTKNFDPLLKRILSEASQDETLSDQFKDDPDFKQHLENIINRVKNSLKDELAIGLKNSNITNSHFDSYSLTQSGLFKNLDLSTIEQKLKELYHTINSDPKLYSDSAYTVDFSSEVPSAILQLSINVLNEINMKNTINGNGPIQIIQSNGPVSGITQTNEIETPLDLTQLTDQLYMLHDHFEKIPTPTVEQIHIKDTIGFSLAESKANKQDSAVKILLKVGKEIFQTTKEIGTSILTEIIKKSLSLS